MPRALEQIMKELDSVYSPQKDIYNKQINALPGLQQAEQKGLESAKNDAFNQITVGANRRGVAFGGIPLEEQSQYLGSSYLPAVANLKNRFQQQRFTMQEALAELAGRQRSEARDIYDREWAREQAEAAARRAASSGGGGGGGGFNLGGFGGFSGVSGNGAAGGQLTPRQQWQIEANQGDYDAQIALNYLDDNFRYDGPVKSGRELEALKRIGAQGNFYYEPNIQSQNGFEVIGAPNSSRGLSVRGTGLIPSRINPVGTSRGLNSSGLRFL